jgi:hypothetical protein
MSLETQHVSPRRHVSYDANVHLAQSSSCYNLLLDCRSFTGRCEHLAYTNQLCCSRRLGCLTCAVMLSLASAMPSSTCDPLPLTLHELTARLP